METVVERPAALDVHKEQVTACVRVPGEGRSREQHVAEFPTTVAGLLTLFDWLAAFGVQQVVMEATGVYWKPVWYVLEEHAGFELELVNPRHAKNLPGRKTDTADAAWLAQLAECGLLRGSFIPPKAVSRLNRPGFCGDSCALNLMPPRREDEKRSRRPRLQSECSM